MKQEAGAQLRLVGYENCLSSLTLGFASTSGKCQPARHPAGPRKSLGVLYLVPDLENTIRLQYKRIARLFKRFEHHQQASTRVG